MKIYMETAEKSRIFSAAIMPLDGPGVPAEHAPMIICVIVRYKNILCARLAHAAESESSVQESQKVMSNEEKSDTYGQTAVVTHEESKASAGQTSSVLQVKRFLFATERVMLH